LPLSHFCLPSSRYRYVKLTLKKDRIGFDKNYGSKESSKKSGTCNPVYGETFTWHDVDNLDNVKLHVKIMDSDIGLDDSLGEVDVDLEHAVLSSHPKEVVAVVDPKRFKIFSGEATIHMHISFA
jgi:C2 domain